MKNDSEVKNLEKHLDRKDAGEDVVKVGQHHVPDHGDNDGDDSDGDDSDGDDRDGDDSDGDVND